MERLAELNDPDCTSSAQESAPRGRSQGWASCTPSYAGPRCSLRAPSDYRFAASLSVSALARNFVVVVGRWFFNQSAMAISSRRFSSQTRAM
jgi:hypothetical protein